MNNEKLSNLVWNSQTGDNDALEQLLLEAYTPVSYLSTRILQDEDLSPRVTQEVLEIIASRLNSLADPDQFQKWMSRITAARCMQAMPLYRHGADRTEAKPLDLPKEGTTLTEEQSAHIIQQMTDRLPEKQRLCILLLGCGGLGIHAIAQLTGFSTDTVSEYLQQGQASIQKQIWELQNQGIELSGLSSLTGILQVAMFCKNPQADPIPVVYSILGKEIPVPPDPAKWIIRILSTVLVLLCVANVVTGGILIMRMMR